MFIRVHSILGEDVFVNADQIVLIQPAYRFLNGQRTETVGATLRLHADFNLQVRETPAAIVELIDRAKESY